jgi:hypothetical protein
MCSGDPVLAEELSARIIDMQRLSTLPLESYE